MRFESDLSLSGLGPTLPNRNRALRCGGYVTKERTKCIKMYHFVTIL